MRGAEKAIDQDPAKVASNNYKVLLENEQVRVLEYRSKPGEKTALHSHPGCVVYSNCPSRLRIGGPYHTDSEIEFQAGEVMWFEGGAHSTENTGPSDAHLLIVEIKQPQAERNQWAI
jgi:quercetin dioxygenase-like cupin family protein